MKTLRTIKRSPLLICCALSFAPAAAAQTTPKPAAPNYIFGWARVATSFPFCASGCTGERARITALEMKPAPKKP